ncbi:hypothetical protein IFM89_030541 [Coptis chinensis]|uniref:Uncharacterized protein n=1 Tax=Coptis chinensis TaxID=261450 RepID=A0A835HSY3_9MAGN|nr:hypothetical protein IFM89_030541 [Coptis chinensis]
MQRSCIITRVTLINSTPTYMFATPLLKLLQQSQCIDLAGTYSIWIIPQLFAYARTSPYKSFAISKQSLGHDHNFRSGPVVSYIIELRSGDKVWPWSSWGCNSGEHLVGICGCGSNDLCGFWVLS